MSQQNPQDETSHGERERERERGIKKTRTHCYHMIFTVFFSDGLARPTHGYGHGRIEEIEAQVAATFLSSPSTIIMPGQPTCDAGKIAGCG